MSSLDNGLPRFDRLDLSHEVGARRSRSSTTDTDQARDQQTVS